MRNDLVTEAVIACALEVHTRLGPGLLESAYQRCLEAEMHYRQIAFVREQPVQIQYRGAALDCGYRADFVVSGHVIVETKAARCLTPVHEAQLLTYLRLADISVGLLINFNVLQLKSGLRRMVLNAPS